jgi:hypothetical protein
VPDHPQSVREDEAPPTGADYEDQGDSLTSGTPPRASNIRQVLSGDLESSFPLVHASSDSCP